MRFQIYRSIFRLFIISFILPITLTSLSAQDDLEITKDFNMFTSQQLQGYSKPLFTTIEESFNSNLFTTAKYREHWAIAFDMSFGQYFIPDAQKSYNADLPELYGNPNVAKTIDYEGRIKQISGKLEQPTIYGGRSNAVYSAPQDHSTNAQNSKSVGFPEGNNIDYMFGLPAIQLIGNFPTRTQIRLRFLPIPVQGSTLMYFAAHLNQRIDHFFDLFGEDTTMALALNGGYSMMSRSKGIDIGSYSFGAHFSKDFDSGFLGYLGFQLEGMSGTFEAIRDIPDKEQYAQDAANSPYEEIRNGDDIKFDIESLNSWRVLAGLSYRTGAFEMHTDFGYAAQSVINFGFTFWLGTWGEEKETKLEKIEQYEEYEKIEKVKKSKKKETEKK